MSWSPRPGATLSKLQIVLDQGGTQTPLYTQGDTAGTPPRSRATGSTITREIGKQTVPDHQVRARAKIIVTAARKVVRNIRTVESTVTPRRRGPPRAARACRWSRPTTTSISAAPR